MSKTKEKIPLMSKARWIILSIYVAFSIIISLIMYLIMAKYDAKGTRDWIVATPAIILAVTFVVWNIYGGQVSKEKFYQKKVYPKKNMSKKEQDLRLRTLISIRRYLLLLMGIEVLVLLFMALVVYTTLWDKWGKVIKYEIFTLVKKELGSNSCNSTCLFLLTFTIYTSIRIKRIGRLFRFFYLLFNYFLLSNALFDLRIDST